MNIFKGVQNSMIPEANIPQSADIDSRGSPGGGSSGNGHHDSSASGGHGSNHW
ncbi:hypothetical protein J8273_7474 [Carpediemonas membranifera]|uniref:Uncharacterized protein n=1 Tax=Carpediemonas membranifera TaxID=201153 RepID=A0A8J6ATN4_9EUKA|nr:hypothetical protein J8273_7474 [Carpediemonas membranifera]|eukprot:KAG9391200.1 hypothetical protein J8273_7474 [Carpediemonas membranifera]